MDRWPAVVAVLLCLLSPATLAGPVVALADSGVTGPTATPAAAAQVVPPAQIPDSRRIAPPPADSSYRSRAAESATATNAPVGGAPSEVAITVYANGSAEWTFRYRTRLQNASEKQDFREFAERFEGQRTRLYQGFTADARSLAADAENVTGRPMNATSFSRNAGIETGTLHDFGVVTMSFRWTNFGREAGERVIVGDVFEGGLYLAPEQRLVISPGPSLVFRSIAPEAIQSNPDSLRRSDSITFTGERRFTDNRPHVVFVPADGSGPGTATATAPPMDSRGSTFVPFLFGGLVLLVGVGAWAYRQNLFEDGTLVGSRTDAGSNGAAAQAEAGDTAVAGGIGASSTSVDENGAPGGRGAATDAVNATNATDTSSSTASHGPVADESAASTDGESTAPSVTAADLQSDEDRVMTLLEDHGGRMRQSQIVEETGWSKSKVSMLLSGMEEEGQITRLRVGRENVVTLPGHEPDAVGRSDADDD